MSPHLTTSPAVSRPRTKKTVRPAGELDRSPAAVARAHSSSILHVRPRRPAACTRQSLVHAYHRPFDRQGSWGIAVVGGGVQEEGSLAVKRQGGARKLQPPAVAIRRVPGWLAFMRPAQRCSLPPHCLDATVRAHRCLSLMHGRVPPAAASPRRTAPRRRSHRCTADLPSRVHPLGTTRSDRNNPRGDRTGTSKSLSNQNNALRDQHHHLMNTL